MSLDLSAEDRKALAKDLAAELDTGRYGNRFVLSRRQLLSIAGGSAGVAGLTALGVDPATAQSAAGQVGTQSSPEDVFAYNLDVQGTLQRDLDAGGQAIENAGSVSTDELNTVPAGVRLTQDTNQTVPTGTVTELKWDSATERNPNAPSFADLANNAITIPSDEYSIARVSVRIRTINPVPIESITPRFNGAFKIGMAGAVYEGNLTTTSVETIVSDWVDVSSGDSFTVNFEHSSGSDEEINSGISWFSLEAY